MRNKKLILLTLTLLLVLGVVAGCGSSEKQAAPAPAAPAKTSAMPNEDPMPIVQDLERKLKDTSVKVQEGKLGDAKIIMAEAVKTHDRLIVHVTDASTKEGLSKAVKEANEAINVSPADAKTAEAKIAAAQSVLKQAMVQLQGHKH